MKKIISILTVLAIVLGLSMTAFAASYDRLDDQANAMSENDQAEAAAVLDEVSAELDADLVFVTVNNSILAGKTEEEYADDYYDSHLYSVDGALLLLNVENGNGWISTVGKGINAFSTYNMEDCVDAMGPYLQSRDYAGAIKVFADKSKEYFNSAANGEPVDIDGNGNQGYEPVDPYDPYYPSREKTPATFGNVLLTIVIAFVIAFLISLIITAVMKGQMKSVISASDADQYVDPNQCHITGSRDRFLYHTVTVVPIPRQDNRQGPGGMGMGGRPGGGSPTHVSHSGTTHGGGGFKF